MAYSIELEGRTIFLAAKAETPMGDYIVYEWNDGIFIPEDDEDWEYEDDEEEEDEELAEEDFEDEELDEDDYDEDDDDYDEYEDDEYDDEYDSKHGKKGKDSDDVNPRMRKITKILTIVVAIIIIFILVFSIGKAAGVFKFGPSLISEDSEEQVKVPNVVGMTEEQAKKALNEKGLGFKVVERKESKKYEEGTVCEQKTEAGKKVAKNTTIQVVVSSGLIGDEITVPDVSGMSEDEAQSALEKEGFKKISSEFEYSDSVAEGDVIGTTPAANSKATKDTEIVMKVSKGAEKKTVPNVVGQQDEDAQNAIKSAGLNVGTVTYDYNDSVPKGQVVSQSVDGGKKVAAGTSVGLVVSNGPKPDERVDVQNFVGRSESDLTSWASGNGLYTSRTGSQTSDTIPKGAIISQSPSSGKVDKGGTITYVISDGPSQNQGGSEGIE